MKQELESEKMSPMNKKWEKAISRQTPLYPHGRDIRSEFERDNNRILHSNAYSRLKHKTQVFFSPQSDHVCTRMEHVNYVQSISYTIANYLGLNTELTRTIAQAHDLGHSPFGHQGEKIMSEIMKQELGQSFWHEKNGLHFVDDVELLEDNTGTMQNLNLTYAVRDGIISHCGEINENGLKPRRESVDLQDFQMPNQFSPYTWEGCIVKIADKISYLGRDLKDAISLGIIEEQDLKELYDILKLDINLNNTVIINELICDLCENSGIEQGICFSEEKRQMLDQIKDFNDKHIYLNSRLTPSVSYFSLVLQQIYTTLKESYQGIDTINKMKDRIKFSPRLVNGFSEWLKKYSNIRKRDNKYQNKIIYQLENRQDYIRAILDYISGMTDEYAMEIYQEIISF